MHWKALITLGDGLESDDDPSPDYKSPEGKDIVCPFLRV